jgi:hypothetical protein
LMVMMITGTQNRKHDQNMQLIIHRDMRSLLRYKIK